MNFFKKLFARKPKQPFLQLMDELEQKVVSLQEKANQLIKK